MASRYRRCWSHGVDEDPPYPTISATLSSPKTTRRVKKSVEVDTGFSGTIAVDEETVEELQLPAIGEITVNTATQRSTPVKLRLVKITIPELRIKQEALAALTATKCLVGRQMIQSRRWLLDNKANEFCLLKRKAR